MSEANILSNCGRCNGTGIDDNVKDENGHVVPESCTSCGGTGIKTTGKIDTTDIMADLDICKKRLRKIMNKLEVDD